MRKNNTYDVFQGNFIHPWNGPIVYGILLFFLGIVIIFFPRILAMMIASVLFFIGFLLISSAWTLRTFFHRYDSFKDEDFEWL